MGNGGGGSYVSGGRKTESFNGKKKDFTMAFKKLGGLSLSSQPLDAYGAGTAGFHPHENYRLAPT